MVFPGEQALGGGPGPHGELGSHGNGVPQADRAFRGGNTDASVALTPEELRALARRVAQLEQDGTGRGNQPVFPGSGGKLNKAAAEHEASLDVPADQPVMHERESQPVNRGPGETGRGDELGQRDRAGLQRIEHHCRFIDDADATRIVHNLILPSHYLRRKYFGWRAAGRSCFS